MNSLHPTAQVIGDVRIGEGNVIGPYAVLIGPLTLGDDNWVGSGTTIGSPPEVRAFDHQPVDRGEMSGGLEIGSANVIREGVQIHRGWRGTTRIEDSAFIMNQSYVAHDCVVGTGVTLASSVLLAGHVTLGAGVNLGMGAVVHQRRVIGDGAMIGMGSVVTRDVLPFAKVYGNPARLHGANTVGLTRAGFGEDVARRADELFRQGGDDLLVRLSELSGLGAAFAGWPGREPLP